MKKQVMLFSILMFIFFASLFFVNAQITECDSDDRDCQIDNAYTCLQDEIDEKTCSKLSDEERIFSLLAAGECRSEVNDELSDGNYDNDIKLTAQAILALNGDNDAEEWLLSQNTTPSELNWFLQIETKNSGICDISYGGGLYGISINEDKELIDDQGGLGTCLDDVSVFGVDALEIDQGCYDEEFVVSCDSEFLTSLLYRKQGSNTLYVSEDTNSAQSGGETTEKVNSACFSKGTTCDYEGSLWSALVLESFGHDISAHFPYLVTLAEDNEEFLPEAFLFPLIGQFKTELLGKQLSNKWWDEEPSSGSDPYDKFYDTALALYALQFESVSQRTNALDWLFSVQGEDGCWDNGDIRDTAFLLYSIEPRSVVVTDGGVNCVGAGYYCMSGISCSEAEGDVLPGYSCSGTFVCCNQQKTLETCSEQSGEICSSSQICSGGTEVDASDATLSKVCCFGGTCKTPSEQPDSSVCEATGGRCDISCLSDETESTESCPFGDICCIQKQGGGIGIVWIVVLLILIVLAVLGIIYRDKLRRLWLRFKSKFLWGKGSQPRVGPGPRPPFQPSPTQRFGPRRIIPNLVRRPVRRPIRPKQSGELKDVLKKLKDIGK